MGTVLKFLVDTGLLFPPDLPVEGGRANRSAIFAEASRLALECRHRLCIHPAARQEILQDTAPAKIESHRAVLRRYSVLSILPEVPAQFESVFGAPQSGTGEWLNMRLIAALAADAVDFLISEDRDLHRKAKRLGLDERVLTITQMAAMLCDLSGKRPAQLPIVEEVKVNVLNPEDPVFGGACRDSRDLKDCFSGTESDDYRAWIVRDDLDSTAACCIAGDDRLPPPSLTGKVLRISFLGTTGRYNPIILGELLLKTVFDYAVRNLYHWVRLSQFLDGDRSITEFLEDFGFAGMVEHATFGGTVFAKPMQPWAEDIGPSHPLQYHLRYGPHHFRTEDVDSFMVPIQPKSAVRLFPESEEQRTMFPVGRLSSNAIRKAYLSNALTSTMTPGSILLFYRSGERKGLIALGIVEKALVSTSCGELLRAMGKRTVYTMEEIEALCSRPVLSVSFRQAQLFRPEIPLSWLIENGILKSSPQSVVKIEKDGLKRLFGFLTDQKAL